MRDRASCGLSYACSIRPNSSLCDWFSLLLTLKTQQHTKVKINLSPVTPLQYTTEVKIASLFTFVNSNHFIEISFHIKVYKVNIVHSLHDFDQIEKSNYHFGQTQGSSVHFIIITPF